MKPISHRTLLRKSRNYRNEQAIMKLAEKDSLKEWSKNTENGKIIEIKRQKVEKPLLGLYEVFKQMMP